MLPQAQMSPRSCVELDREVFEQTNIARRLIRRRPAGDRGGGGASLNRRQPRAEPFFEKYGIVLSSEIKP